MPNQNEEKCRSLFTPKLLKEMGRKKG